MKTLSLTLTLLIVAAAAVLAPTVSAAGAGGIGVVVSVGFAPPPLPVYAQPVCPGDGYIWTPGYWAYYDANGYYWVPGTWVLAPQVGFLWTPPYWGFVNGAYIFHAGYWGPHVGFYGGVAYGFGYFGTGFVGGRWEGGRFFYNRAASNVNVTIIHNTYNTRVHETVNRVSYNGGPGGIRARASAEQERFAAERHEGAVAAQTRHMEEARANRELRATENHGKPAIAATMKPGEWNGKGAIAARAAGGAYHAPPAAATRAVNENRNPEHHAVVEKRPNAVQPAVHPNDLPQAERMPAPHTGNAKIDQKYQQQQDKLMARQAKENQQLQQRQEKEHQQMAGQQATQARQQQVEQKHQQQTEHLAQQHAAQQHKMQQRQQPPPQQHAANRPQGGGKPDRP